MKVGIFTFPNSVSYGATLQMYALYDAVNRMGHDAEIINYHNAYMKAEKHRESSKDAAPIKSFAKKTMRTLIHFRLYCSFRRFEKENMKLYPLKPFTEKQKLPDIGNRYNAVICGSDQIWNPDITDTDLSYFLDFCGKNTRRISYAPSFGIDKFSDDFSKLIEKELAEFHALSVREKPGQDFICKLLGKEASLVADPTFLVSSDQWTKLERKHSAANGEYILYYTIRRSDNLLRHCMEFSSKTGLKVVIVGGNYLKVIRNRNPLVEYAIDIGPDEWLYLLHNARYIFTNSFHGTAFSINYNKDFFVEFSSLTNSRLEQIIGALKLENRIVKTDNELSVEPIDYTSVEKYLSELRKSSEQFLNTALR